MKYFKINVTIFLSSNAYIHIYVEHGQVYTLTLTYTWVGKTSGMTSAYFSFQDLDYQIAYKLQ